MSFHHLRSALTVRPQRHERRRTCRPAIEALEERALLTAGALDPTFDLDGRVTTDLHLLDRANAVAHQPDGSDSRNLKKLVK